MKQQKYQFLRGFDNRHITIGFGSYGQVKLARNTSTGEQVAIKFIYNKNAKDEIEMHNQLEHPNIVRLLNHFYEEEKRITYMVLEFISGGTLFEKIKTTRIPKKTQSSIFRGVCSAVAAMHANNIMHRDLKPQNILLTKNDEAKVCDFGFATICGDRKTLCGTYEYMAPEMIQNQTYGKEVDVWALGVLLFELVEGSAPFQGESASEVLSEMKKSIYFSDKFNEDEISLIKSILRVNKRNRPSAEQILQHKYFGSIKKDSLVSTCSSELDSVKEPVQKIFIPGQESFKVKQAKRLKTFQDADSPLSPKRSPLDFAFHERSEKFAQNLQKHLMLQPTEPSTPEAPQLCKIMSFQERPDKFTSPVKLPFKLASPPLKQALSLKYKKNLDLSIKSYRSQDQLDLSSSSSAYSQHMDGN